MLSPRSPQSLPHRDASVLRPRPPSLTLANPPSPRSRLGSMIECLRCDDVEGAIALGEADELARSNGES